MFLVNIFGPPMKLWRKAENLNTTKQGLIIYFNCSFVTDGYIIYGNVYFMTLKLEYYIFS